jgi:hypothetical protein
MRRALLPLLAAVVLVPVEAGAQTPTTTRIETRPVYGATVTFERGVRVFRPLPPTERVIINPHGKTPLALAYQDYRSVSENHHYNHGNGGPAIYAPGGGAYYLGDGKHKVRVIHGVTRGHGGHRGHGGVGRGVGH